MFTVISLIGDLTNLVGCILTHQLPFQVIPCSLALSIASVQTHHFLDTTCHIFLHRRYCSALSVRLLSQNCHSDGVSFLPFALACWFPRLSLKREGTVSLPHTLRSCGQCSFCGGGACHAKE